VTTESKFLCIKLLQSLKIPCIKLLQINVFKISYQSLARGLSVLEKLLDDQEGSHESSKGEKLNLSCKQGMTLREHLPMKFSPCQHDSTIMRSPHSPSKSPLRVSYLL
jgi:hypothetical protein